MGDRYPNAGKLPSKAGIPWETVFEGSLTLIGVREDIPNRVPVAEFIISDVQDQEMRDTLTGVHAYMVVEDFHKILLSGIGMYFTRLPVEGHEIRWRIIDDEVSVFQVKFSGWMDETEDRTFISFEDHLKEFPVGETD